MEPTAVLLRYMAIVIFSRGGFAPPTGAFAMKPSAIIGIILVVLGIAGFAIGHFSYTTDKTVVALGPLTATVGEQHNVDIPDIAAGAAVLAGVVLLIAGMRRSA
jgi:uncharacterized membrane protein